MPAGRGPTERIQSRWASFAESGDPNPTEAAPLWPRYGLESRPTYLIGRRDRVVGDPYERLRRVWGESVIAFP